MIVITGAAGFIGSCLAGRLNREGEFDLVLVDNFSCSEKTRNTSAKVFAEKTDRSQFFIWLEKNNKKVNFIFHIGARTDTAEFNMEILDELNLNYSKELWRLCTKHNIPLVYASSAATYGGGEAGYDDNHELIGKLKPLNPYGISKNEFDKWALKQISCPPFWAGLKFFNVYGPNEYHKGRMASVIFHAFNQIKETGKVKLFRSHNPKYEDGGQMRDFIYVRDVVDVLLWFFRNQKQSAIYNVGTGRARTFLDLALSIFTALGQKPDIIFIDTPADIRDKYQYFTEARMDKIRMAGYLNPFTGLESGVKDYVSNYLVKRRWI